MKISTLEMTPNQRRREGTLNILFGIKARPIIMAPFGVFISVSLLIVRCVNTAAVLPVA